jgi:hypothetical protein
MFRHILLYTGAAAYLIGWWVLNGRYMPMGRSSAMLDPENTMNGMLATGCLIIAAILFYVAYTH